MKLSQYAKKLGVTYKTAWYMFDRGEIPGAYRLPSHTIIVPDEAEKAFVEDRTAIYARVSSSENKDDLDRQIERLENFAAAKGYKIVKSVKEIASGLNDHRKQLEKLLLQEDWNILLVEHKDRLTRFGFNYLDILLKKEGRIIEVINEIKDEKTDLIDDFISIITSFCVRIYGHRRSARKTEQIIQHLNEEESS